MRSDGPHRASSSRARALRKKLTPPERVLWSRLRNKGLGGYKFRRQQPIGPYVADFYCARCKLVVEVDSAWHMEHGERDENRDEWMRSEGIEVMRIQAADLLKNEAGVLDAILRTCDERAESM